MATVVCMPEYENLVEGILATEKVKLIRKVYSAPEGDFDRPPSFTNIYYVRYEIECDENTEKFIDYEITKYRDVAILIANTLGEREYNGKGN